MRHQKVLDLIYIVINNLLPEFHILFAKNLRVNEEMPDEGKVGRDDYPLKN
jgi:hypothetical protein